MFTSPFIYHQLNSDSLSIDRLPVELIVCIILACWGRGELRPRYPRNKVSNFVLIQVNRQWRRIALQEHSLWTDISIITLENIKYLDEESLLDWLERSKGKGSGKLLVDIIINFSPARHEGFYYALFRRIIRIMSEEVHWWGYVNVSGDRTLLRYASTIISQATDLMTMDIFQSTSQSSYMGTIPPPHSTFCALPHLHMLAMSTYMMIHHEPQIRSQTMKHLMLYWMNEALVDWHMLLRNFPNVDTLTLQNNPNSN